MGIELDRFEDGLCEAVKLFWASRTSATLTQTATGRHDQGNRSAVTSGKNMDGFARIVAELVEQNGLPRSTIHTKRRDVTLPGFFRPTKMWDLVVVHDRRLVAALEFKSQVGPSFGNNVNNRSEEALGNAVDLWTAFRERSFGESRRPFVGYVFLLEESAGSMNPVGADSGKFLVREEFQGSSYAERYRLLCEKLVLEKHYSAAALVLSDQQEGAQTGRWRELSESTSIKRLGADLAGHVAAEAALRGR